jgi:hypothetical protein
MDGPPPVRTDKPSYTIDLSGMIFLWAKEQPVLMRVVGDPRWHLPVFSSLDNLKRAVREFGLEYERIKQIEVGHEFLDSIWESASDVVVIVDPRKHNGRVRYTQVKDGAN